MYMIVGLGNPGSKYRGTRHNIGFDVVDAFWLKHGGARGKNKFKADYGKLEIAGDPVVLLKPQTFMNLSGESVQPAAAFFKLKPQEIIVVHDELDLPLGRIRLKRGGGTGGHNGLKSIKQHLRTPDFFRLRFGIGRPVFENAEGEKVNGDVSSYVLGSFSSVEQDRVPAGIDLCCSILESVLKDGPQAAMTRWHSES